MSTKENTLPSTEEIANQTLVLILAGGRGSRLYELTDQRAKPAVYFGGGHRIIDFALSNCINSGLLKIGVITYTKRTHSCATCNTAGPSCRANATSSSICCRRVSSSMTKPGTGAPPMPCGKTCTS